MPAPDLIRGRRPGSLGRRTGHDTRQATGAGCSEHGARGAATARGDPSLRPRFASCTQIVVATLKGGVAMTRRRRRSDRSGRAPLFSPGRPVVTTRDEQRRFWAAIAAGMASEDAALQAGMSQAVGTRLFRKAGGMPPAMFRPSAKPLSGRYLLFSEREEIALLRVQGCSMREVARRLGRAASTISRELRRNASTRSGSLEYRATTAQWHAERSARRPKQAKLALNRHCEPMWRNDWQGSLSLRVGLLFLARLCAGTAAGMGRGSIGGGQTPGAQSRLLAACRLTSRTMRPCASAMKPSIKRCSFKVVARCGAS